ncbi:XRE family transcriptional regulator [Kribbella speibonae]|uniref:XRE family transcriptional regulator n=1 Tax=Kribbella speibonae TaxID=1572660 RepID=A0ABY1ZUJ0_9ACTN|nr:XRE family transcriptional regulator [Kribbella speibonae]
MPSQVEVLDQRPSHLSATAPSDHSAPSASIREPGASMGRTRRKRRACRFSVFTCSGSPRTQCAQQVWAVGCGNSPQPTCPCFPRFLSARACSLAGTHHMSSKRERGGPVTETPIGTSFGTSFGPLLRQCRQAVGLSLRQLAARVGYDHSYLSQVERGQRPGSADLARLCDRELGTEGRLTATFERRPARADQLRPEAGPLETAWRGLVATLGSGGPMPDDFRNVPPAALLPELVRQMQGADGAEAAELSMLIAETLARLGERHTARRWWWAARTAADSIAAGPQPALVRAREVITGLAERRPLAELLELADESVALDRQAPGAAGCVPRTAQALVLAELGRTQEAHCALQELIGVGDELAPEARPYQLHWAEGRVCTLLGYGVAGCVLLERARELCPESWIGERARLDLSLAECLVVAGETAAGLATALRVLVELPDEWHDSLVYDAGARVLHVVQAEPGAAELRQLLARSAYRSGRSVGGGSSWR